jgi:large conductance mechanosensitive channel
MFGLYFTWKQECDPAAMKELLDEFKAFIMRGNVIELAVAVVIGTAFTKLVGDATKFLIEPILGMILAGKGIDVLDWRFLKLGSFLMSVINFAITAAVVFFLFVKPLNRIVALFGKKEEPGTPPASLNDVVTELKEVKEELRRARGGTGPLP